MNFFFLDFLSEGSLHQQHFSVRSGSLLHSGRGVGLGRECSHFKDKIPMALEFLVSILSSDLQTC